MTQTKRFYDGLDKAVRDILLAQIRNLWTHTSTAIEGNTLTLGETAFLLEEGLTVSGKPLKDHQEIVGHAKAIELIYTMLERDAISEGELFLLHKAVLSENIADIYAPKGAWKNQPNYTNYVGPEGKQGWREYPAPAATPRLMRQWIAKFNAHLKHEMSRTEATRAYATAHLEFVTIHPFYDGNGRLARLLANVCVLKAGYPPLIIPASARQKYLRLISDYQSTISDLAEITDLAQLPQNAEAERFASFCGEHWAETLDLVAKAQALQQKRALKPETSPAAEASESELSNKP